MAFGELARLFVRIDADSTGVRTAFGQIQSEATKLGRSMEAVGHNLFNAGQFLTVGLTAPLAAIGGLSVKASTDFGKAFADVQEKVSGTTAQFASLRQGAIDMSKTLPFSATAILQVDKAAGQLGIRTEDIQTFTKTMLQMAEVTGQSAQQMADGMGASMAKIANIMQMPQDQFSNMGSAILALGKIGASTEQDIVDMALRIAGAGKVVGLSTDQVLGFANALATVGLDAEAGGTAISRAFVEMANSVAGISQTPEQLAAMQDAENGVKDASDRLADAQRGLASAQRDQASAQLDATQAAFDARRETLSVAEAQQHLGEVTARQGSHALDLRAAQQALSDAQSQVAKTSAEAARKSLAVAQAQQRLKEVMAQGGAATLEMRNAQLTLEEAQSRVGNAARRQAENVAGADAKVADASRGVARAQEEVGRAQQKVSALTDEQKGKLEAFAKVAGMSADEFQRKFKTDAAGAMVDFINGLSRIQKEGGNVFDVLDKLGLGEIRVRDSLLRLSGAQGVLEQNLGESSKAFKDNTEIARQAAIANDTAAAKFTMLKNRLVDASIAIGATLTPMVLKLTQLLGPLFSIIEKGIEIFSKLPAPVQIAVVTFLALLAAIGPLLLIIGGMASGIGAIIGVMGLLGISFAGGTIIVGGLAASFGALVIAALPWIALAVVIGAGLYLLIKHWDDVKAAISSAAHTIEHVAVGAFKAVLAFVKDHWKTIAVLITGPFAGLVALATDAFGVRSALVHAFEDLPAKIAGFAGGIASAIGNAFSGATGAAGGFLGGLAGSIASAFSGAVSAVVSGVASIASAIATNFTAENIGAAFAWFFLWPSYVISTGVNAALAVLYQFLFHTLPDAFTGAIAFVVPAALNLGSSIIHGIWDGIQSAWGFITGIPGAIATALINGFTAYVGSWLDLGAKIIQGIGNGAKGAWSFITTIPGAVKDAIVGGFTAYVNDWLDLGSKIISGISDGITAGFHFITSAPGAIKSAFVTAFNTVIGEFESIGRAIVKGIVKGVEDAGPGAIKAVVNFAKGFAKGVKDALGIKSPSKVFQDIGEQVVAGFGIGLQGMGPAIAQALEEGVSKFSGLADQGKGELDAEIAGLNAFLSGQLVAPEWFQTPLGRLMAGFKAITGAVQQGVGATATTALQKYLDFALSSGDVLNDWLTHIDASMRASAIAQATALLKGRTGPLTSIVGSSAGSSSSGVRIASSSGGNSSAGAFMSYAPATSMASSNGLDPNLYDRGGVLFKDIAAKFGYVSVPGQELDPTYYDQGGVLFKDIATKFGYYEKGTGFVPSNMLAFLHKGEAVIPAWANKPIPAFHMPSMAYAAPSLPAATASAMANPGGGYSKGGGGSMAEVLVQTLGPLTIQNIGNKNDKTKTLRNVGYALRARGIYA